ncbi:alpha/beta hydrolase [Rhodococcus opacus]|uniref:alpha/beta fold hydrolase n=1 Tax=Rhodococcus opacus TaxID=37919 RepID=UPI0007CD46A9|nr:alpha/beta hydrolase [Rhodococcus opacus]MDX5962462.1 alpha/beta hydrolase [Rhodococcus opacus]CAG7640008.1 Putative non-heme bromoperoxidase BpoC [Rhodococcus opacus]
MPTVTLNNIPITYAISGTGPRVLLIMGTGSPGRVWNTYQVPALVKAGFQVVTMDNRGISHSHGIEGMSIDDLAADAAALIKHLGGPAHVVGTSMGARVVQELAVARPELVLRAIMIGATGKPYPVESALNRGRQALHAQGIELPATYAAAVTALLNLSPRTLADPQKAQEWLDIFEYSAPATTSPGVRAQVAMDRSRNRLADYARILAPTLVIGFGDDRMTPPEQGREVAAAIPGARYQEIPHCGHFGYLEQPDAVNALLIAFLAGNSATPEVSRRSVYRS